MKLLGSRFFLLLGRGFVFFLTGFSLWLGSGLVLLADSTSAADHNILAQLLHDAGANTFYFFQIVDSLECAVLVAIIDDGLGLAGAVILQSFKLGLGGSVDVDARMSGSGEREHCNNEQ